MRWATMMQWAAIAALGMGALPAQAQIQTIDPNTAIESDVPADPGAPPADSAYPQRDPGYPAQDSAYPRQDDAYPTDDPTYSVQDQGYPQADRAQVPPPRAPADPRQQAADTFQDGDVLAAAEGVFGKGAAGLAGIVEDILKDQGRPNAYIAGREAGGALILGVRYGSGTMVHKVEGPRQVFWTGPSVGFDVGGDANNVFVLVYNLYDSQELYKRFPAGEGHVYFVGGFTASYLRRGDVVLIPIRLGVGWRLGINAGYMKFSEKRRWQPF